MSRHRGSNKSPTGRQQRAEPKIPSERTFDSLTEEALELYRRALELRSTHVDTLYNCGHVLYSQSRLSSSEAEVKRLLREAASMFSRVVAQDGTHAAALFNWGLALVVLADRADQGSAGQCALYGEACTRFQQLSQVLQANQQEEAEMTDAPPSPADGGAAPMVLTESPQERVEREVMEAALEAQHVSRRDLLSHWAEALAKHAQSAPSRAEADPLFAQAFEKFQQLIAVAPKDPEARAAFASGLIAQAEVEEERGGPADTSVRLLRSAQALLEEALVLDPSCLPALASLGDALHALANERLTPEPAARAQCCTAALARYEAGLAALKRSFTPPRGLLQELASQAGDVALDLAKLAPVEARAAWLSKAEAFYRLALAPPASAGTPAPAAAADSDSRGTTIYNLACVYALQGRARECKDALDAVLKEWPEDLADAHRDPDLAAVSSLPWFQPVCVAAAQRNRMQP